jgi:histidinol-phosphate aminotransferase
MSRFWHPRVAGLTPYVPGEQPKLGRALTKLNTNENPYPPSSKVLAAIREAADDALRLYPDPTSSDLRQAIAEYYQMVGEQVFVGNGSDEVLAFVFQSLFRSDAPLLFPDISYSFYPVYAALYAVPTEIIPLNSEFEIDLADYHRSNGGIIFPNPNAPTGMLLGLDAIEALLNQNHDSVVVVDEAYIDFGGESAIHLVNRYPNLLVTQSFSKSRSLAGLRLGFAVGHPDLIEALNRVKDSFNSYPIDRLASAGGIAAMQDVAYFEQIRQQVVASREEVVVSLQALGFEVLPSAANFVFARHPQYDAARLMRALRDEAVIVRHFNKPRIDQFLRITIGTPEENAALLSALRKALA